MSSPRSATAESLEIFITKCAKFQHSPKILHSSSVEESLKNAILAVDKPVVVAGSFYLVGQVIQILENGSTT